MSAARELQHRWLEEFMVQRTTDLPLAAWLLVQDGAPQDWAEAWTRVGA